MIANDYNYDIIVVIQTVSPEATLKTLAQSSWIDFKKVVSGVPAPTLPAITGPHTMKTIRSILIDRRYTYCDLVGIRFGGLMVCLHSHTMRIREFLACVW